MPAPLDQCDLCGLCCTNLIVEIEHLDVVREPRLLPGATLLKAPFTDGFAYDDEWDKQYMLACGSARPCAQLGPGNLCAVYPSRPNVCVGFEAGSEQCRELRDQHGLAPLAAVTEVPRA